MTIYNSTNNISEDYTFIIDIDEILYTEQELVNLELDIYQCDDPELDELVWHTTNNITGIYNTLKEDNDLSSIGLLDTDIDCKDIFSAIINNEASTHTYIGLQNNDRTNLPTFDENQYFILLAKEEDNLFLCIPIKHYGLYNNIRIVDINTFEPADFEYLSAKQVQNLIYSLISKMEILEFVDTLPPKASARTNLIYLLTETPSDPTDLVDDGLNLNFGLYIYSKTLNDYKKLDTLTFDIKQFAKKNHTHAIADVTDLQTTLDSKASSTDLTNGLQNIGGYTIHTVYNVSGRASAYDISSGLLYTQLTPVVFLVKNTIGDNEANATLKYYPNGNNITIMDTFSTSDSPIQQGVWKKDTWALFFCYGNSTVQLRCVFYDSVDIDKKILDLSELELIDSTHSLASTANWTGTSTRLTSLTKGTRILYRITYVPTAHDQGATLSIRFTNNTVSSYIPIIFSNGVRNNSKWFISSIAKNDVLLLEYDGNNWVLLDFFAIGERPDVARTGSYNDLTDKPTIVDNLTTNDATKILSARQGKVLNDNKADKTDGASQITDPTAYSNIGTSANATQSIINTAIDTKIGELETLIGDAITYINGTGGN